MTLEKSPSIILPKMMCSLNENEVFEYFQDDQTIQGDIVLESIKSPFEEFPT